MGTITVIAEDERVVPGGVVGERVVVERAALPDALGWELKDQGLCQEGTCVPVCDAGALLVGGRLDLAAVAAALGRVAVADPRAAMVAVSLAAADRRRALVGRQVPPVELPDLEGRPHRFDEWSASKKLLVTFSSWCGCRYDLPGWQALHDELAPSGFTVVAVALDDDPADVVPFTGGITMPVLLDRQHVLTELLAISNVPTVVWIDEEDRIVRPNAEAFGSDLFADFTGVASGPHLDLVRRWATTGEVPDDAAGDVVADLSADEVLARLHFRLGAAARRRGDPTRDDRATAERHLRRASELAPFDFTVRRAAMPLMGEDPFGDGFLALYDRWREEGRPYHGLPPAGAGAGEGVADRSEA